MPSPILQRRRRTSAPPPPAVDNVPPAQPTLFALMQVVGQPLQMQAAFVGSSDNVGVVRYDLYFGPGTAGLPVPAGGPYVKIKEIAHGGVGVVHSYLVTAADYPSIAAATHYRGFVIAYDAVGNPSVRSNDDGADTAAAAPGSAPFAAYAASARMCLPDLAGPALDQHYAFRNGNVAHSPLPKWFIVDAAYSAPVSLIPGLTRTYRGGLRDAAADTTPNNVIWIARADLYTDPIEIQFFSHNCVVFGSGCPPGSAAAPGGANLRCALLYLRGGNVWLRGLRVFGDVSNAFNPDGSSRTDCSIGNAIPPVSRGLATNCEFYGSPDEIAKFFAGYNQNQLAPRMDGGAYRCIFAYGFSDSVHELYDHDTTNSANRPPYGVQPTGLFSSHSGGVFAYWNVYRFGLIQNAMFHIGSRTPCLSYAQVNIAINNGIYNNGCHGHDAYIGYPPTTYLTPQISYSEGAGFGIHPDDPEQGQAQSVLFAKNSFLRGPEAFGTVVGTATASIQITGNVETGRGFATQNDFANFETQSHIVGTTPADCLIDGITANAGSSDSITNTLVGQQAFWTKLSMTAGAQPKMRFTGHAATLFQQAMNYLNGSGAVGSTPNRPEDIPGFYPTVTVRTIALDAFITAGASGQADRNQFLLGRAMPAESVRDIPDPSLSFDTPGERWCLDIENQYNYT